MHPLFLALFAVGFYPLYRAWLATRRTSLFHAVHWGIAAWLAWGVTLMDAVDSHPDPAAFLALSLTACAGVAVLGARRPHVAAWDFVVLGLLAVLLLPLLESMFLGARTLGVTRAGFLAAVLVVGLLNYLPTRFGPAAFLLGLGCAGELVGLLAPEPLPRGGEDYFVKLCWLAAPWLALVRVQSKNGPDELDMLWREFRDRWGFVWAQRIRGECNRAAVNNRWPWTLGWGGFCFDGSVDAATRAEAQRTLIASLKRFIAGDDAKK